jgi:hypothetical protein
MPRQTAPDVSSSRPGGTAPTRTRPSFSQLCHAQSPIGQTFRAVDGGTIERATGSVAIDLGPGSLGSRGVTRSGICKPGYGPLGDLHGQVSLVPGGPSVTAIREESMSIHIHTVRNWCAKALVLVPAPFVIGWASKPGSPGVELAQVSGQVACADRPVGAMIDFLPADGRGPVGSGYSRPDGSFQLYVNGRRDRRGAVPGTYRVVVVPYASDPAGSVVDRKYLHPHTTDLVVHIAPGWNHVCLNLQESPIRTSAAQPLGFRVPETTGYGTSRR